jgi:hypothetical protein
MEGISEGEYGQCAFYTYELEQWNLSQSSWGGMRERDGGS